MQIYSSLAAVAVFMFLTLNPSAYAQTATTTTLSIAPSAVAEGQSATLSASVIPSSGSTPNGRVSFFCETTMLASSTLNGSGSATVTLSSANVPPGRYTLTARYAGNSTDAASTSSPVSATVLADTTTTLTSAASSYLLGKPATLTASVSSKSGKPAGSIGFYSGATLLGSASLKSGEASITQTIPVSYEAGTYRIVAKYSGDTNFAPSSGSFSITLNFDITPSRAALAPFATAQFSLSPTPVGSETWFVNGIPGGNSSAGTISSAGLYTAPSTTTAVIANISAAVSSAPHYTASAVPVYIVPAGVLAATANGQVASYTINLPAGSLVSAQFGTTSSYGLNTWSLPAPSGGGPVTLLIVGMLKNTLYHVRGLISLPDGLSLADNDIQFTTSRSLTYPPAPTITTTPGETPQPGIEFLDRLQEGAYISDIDGNYLWGYPLVGTTNSDNIHPFKLLSNGHLLLTESPTSSYPIDGSVLLPGTAIRTLEIDYTNAIIRELDLPTLQSNLNASGYVNDHGQQITLAEIHHDVVVNPNTGHWILIANTVESVSGLKGYPKGVNVLGDVIIDVDPDNNFAVDWVWNEFDHLDITRQPMGFPDWTHTNAVVYSSDDHNILISIRHQNWVVKVNYDDSAGDGSILWRLGYQGDFDLKNGASPQDWQYAQHAPSFTTSNTTGNFGLVLMDNGNDRILNTGAPCPVALSGGQCLYSRAPVFTIDENAMTAAVSHGAITGPYSYYGGSAQMLANGDIEADYCGVNGGSLIQETTSDESAQVVLKIKENGNIGLYRAFRAASPYPGIIWSDEAQRLQAEHATPAIR